VIGDHITVARDLHSRQRGLLDYDSLPLGGGMWINPGSAIHTVGMKFPIDVVFLEVTPVRYAVVCCFSNVQPEGDVITCGLANPTRSVLELPVGTIARCGLRPGMTVTTQSNQ
jgi:hypothetical protein